jgi:small ligand-binding sensory domain FIST
MVKRMSIRIGSGLSTDPDVRLGAIEAAAAAREALDGDPADLAVVFACGSHLAAPEATLEGVHEALAPRALVGCGAGGVLGEGREIEDGTAVAVWAASLDEGVATPFHAEASGGEDGGVVFSGVPELSDAAGVILLPDPFSFPTDRLLRDLAVEAPGVPVVGGISSARTLDGSSALFLDEDVVEGGAVGLRLDDLELLPCVSQGAAPVGPEMTVTAAEGHVIHELAGRPALVRLREAIESMSDVEREALGGGLLVGIVIDGDKPDYRQGDFLVRGLLGTDPEAGTVTVGSPVRPGQVLRLHARDAESADRDLREALDLRVQALGGDSVAGALLFSCNGRGRAMFGAPHHDASTLERVFGGVPAAGFFAAGEIGPVGGESFLHGFTATVAIFPG